MDLNHVMLIGRLTRDADYKVLPSGQAVCNFSIAVNRRRKVGDNWEDEANYFDIVLWGKQADSLNRYLVKGKQVGIDGELRQDRWQQDGQNRSKVVISANNVQLLGGAQGGGAPGGYGGGAPGGYGGGAPGGYGGGGQGGGYGGGGQGGGYGGPPPTHGGVSGGGVPADDFVDDVPF
ncbi:MAG: single-stranded DNA-binding protein [Spirochaetaceae bacterium]|jgi:single-strand DNA-binding protein|nr:single-stranded DNA-binding protein [Spirochaetaceae bacterium]